MKIDMAWKTELAMKLIVLAIASTVYGGAFQKSKYARTSSPQIIGDPSAMAPPPVYFKGVPITLNSEVPAESLFPVKPNLLEQDIERILSANVDTLKKKKSDSKLETVDIRLPADAAIKDDAIAKQNIALDPLTVSEQKTNLQPKHEKFIPTKDESKIEIAMPSPIDHEMKRGELPITQSQEGQQTGVEPTPEKAEKKEEPASGICASREECITKRLNDLGLTSGTYTFDSDMPDHVLLVKVSPPGQLEWREEYRQRRPKISDSNSERKDGDDSIVRAAKKQEISRKSAYPYHSHKSRPCNQVSSTKPKSSGQHSKAEEKGKAPRKYYRPKDAKSGSSVHKEKKPPKEEKEAKKSTGSNHQRHHHHHRRRSSSSSSE